ncbi:hypothetical protein Dimus_027827 [Dionaea muscipula]
MDFPHFAQETFWASSQAVDGALEYPPQMANAHGRRVHDSPSFSEIPPEKRPRSGENSSYVVRNKETTRFVHNSYMDIHGHRRELGRWQNSSYVEAKRFWDGVSDSKHSVCHEMARNNNVDGRVENGMKLCNFISRGEECPYGEKCIFLHGRMGKCKGKNIGTTAHERWEKDEGSLGSGRSYAISIKTCDRKDSRLEEEFQSSRWLSWKTRLCNKREVNGSCPYGVRCIFAHGQAELRKNSVFAASISRADEDISMICEARPRVGASNEQLLEKKSRFKWERTRKTKIVGIYADWINENSMLHCSINDDRRP